MLTKISNAEHVSRHAKASQRTAAITTRDSANNSAVETPGASFSPLSILNLQSTIGNRAVRRMLAPLPHATGESSLQRAPTDTLTDDQVQAAVRYNKSRRFSVEIIKQIQQLIGINDDGVVGSGTARAIAAWQAQQGLAVDGKIGPATFARLIPSQSTSEAPASTQSQAENAAPPEQGGMLHSMIGGLAGTWDSIAEGATEVWESITDLFGDGATPSTPTEEPASNEPAQPNQPSELDQLMLQDRLSVEEIRRARELIDQVTDEKTRGDLYEALQAKVEYHSQRDNKSTSGSKNIGDVMCNLTSLAMALSYLGVPNPDPSKQYEDALEDIRVAKRLPARTTAEGWGGVAKELGVTAEFLGYDLKKDKDWYTATVEPKLRDGYAVMMSISGHIVRMQDVTENGLIIDDPFGVVTLGAGEKWSYNKANKNAREGEGSNRGEDSAWAWQDVSTHNMRWIAALK